MVTRRPRHRAGRALLVRMLVVASALLSLCSLCASPLTTQDAALGVMFARACAAEDALAHHNEPRLRLVRDEVGTSDIHALVQSPGSLDTILRRIRDGASADDPLDGTRSLASALWIADRTSPAVLALANATDRGVDSVGIDPPTRGRARLMVFLN